MSLGLIGKKVGMTKVYDENGVAIAVTVVDVSGNNIVQVKQAAGPDGYAAVQVGYDDQRESRMSKPRLGHFKKHGSGPKRIVREFRMTGDDQLPAGDTPLGADLFPVGAFVDVIGTTKGKGFQGAIMTHGSMMHRRTGSIGCRLTPGLVWKNQKMPGHDGVSRRTTQNLKVIQSRPEDGVLLISGSIPGSKGGYIIVRPAKKRPAVAAS